VPDYPGEFTEGLAALGRLGVDVQTLDERLGRIGTLACAAIGPSDDAGVTLIRNGRPVTRGHTADLVPAIDETQYETGKGPCLDAYRHGEVNRIDSTSEDSRWPEFSKVAARAGVRSTLSLPMRIGDERVGALNLYSSTPARFSEAHERLGAMFAEQAAVAIANTEMFLTAREMSSQLEEALKTRDVIGQAKGIIMEREKITADEAFDILRTASQRRNVKLRALAEEVARTGALPEG
jgi:GAF domain-containing protein